MVGIAPFLLAGSLMGISGPEEVSPPTSVLAPFNPPNLGIVQLCYYVGVCPNYDLPQEAELVREYNAIPGWHTSSTEAHLGTRAIILSYITKNR